MASEEFVYIYGICQRPDADLILPLGLERETELVYVEQLAAVVEYGIDLEALQTNDQRLLNAVLSHDRIVCDVFNQVAILPIRFGTQLASTKAVKEYLSGEYATYLGKLQALEQKCEYQIKLIPEAVTAPPTPEGLKGRDYFLAKKQRLQDQNVAQEQQQAELTDLVARTQALFPDTIGVTDEDGTAKVYVLLQKDQASTLKAQIAQWQAETRFWNLSLSEALPPYHFV
jgi:hypothetical protein